jgi:23S rRNA pseudouridine1911/1915/1917 synthase
MRGSDPAPAQLSDSRILRETSELVILDKPSGWHTVARRTSDDAATPDVESWLRIRHDWARPLNEAGIVHRLDRETSGCLLIAKDGRSQERLRARFQSGDPGIRKIYLAVVEAGLPEIGEFHFHFISRYKRSKKVTVLESGNPRHEGRCAWRVSPLPSGAEGIRGEMRPFNLVEIELIGPGRRHQIRAGLAHLGHPLIGDTIYGSTGSPPTWKNGSEEREVRDAETGFERPCFFLHAWKLTIDDAETMAPLPIYWPA